MVKRYDECENIHTGNVDFCPCPDGRFVEYDDYAALQAENERLKAACLDMYSALYSAEASLADIGDADREPGDDVAWCERRAYSALPKVRGAIAAWKEGQSPPPAIDMEKLRILAQGSIDSLTQNKVYPADVSAAISSMRHLLGLIDAHKGE